jgi:RNA polymerase sigma-70 factor (ECF subfamily)
VAARDPLENPAPLIRRVYSYVAYRTGDGPEAEDLVSEVFERALRYRKSYDPRRGAPLTWLLGIARRCVDDALRRPLTSTTGPPESASAQDLEAETVERLTLAAAIDQLDERARDLLALRYGADLSARQIGVVLGLKTNAVEVALHRVITRLRAELQEPDAAGPTPFPDPASRTSP